MNKSTQRGLVMRLFFIVIIVLTLASGCRKSPNAMADHADPSMIELLLDSFVVTEVKLFAKPMVKGFYTQNGYRMLWTEGGKFIKSADTILSIIRSAKYYGLIPSDYHHAEIEELLKLPADDVTRSRIDILLTDAFFLLRYHLGNGRLNRKNFNPVRYLNKIDSAALTGLEEAVRKNSVRQRIEEQEPQHKPYRALKKELRDLITQFSNDSLNIIKLSSRGARFEDDRMLRIFVNLERWRWQDRELPERYVVVNVPSYTMYVVEEDKVVFQSAVIVGDVDHESPVLTSTITCFVIYPYWHVPRSIATKELLPKIQANPDYVEANNFEVLDYEGNILDPSKIKWKKINEHDFSYLLRQREGPENSLGIIKFVFENPYGVYLHDTNARRLFKNDYRALSHGCVRVEKAREFAKYLACYNHKCSAENLDRYFRERKRKEVTIKNSIPVFIRYFTVDTFGDSAGYHQDVYNKDDKILRSFNFTRGVL